LRRSGISRMEYTRPDLDLASYAPPRAMASAIEEVM